MRCAAWHLGMLATALAFCTGATTDPLQLPVRTGASPAATPLASSVAAGGNGLERPAIPAQMIDSTARQIEAQAAGNYGPMERLTQLPQGSINRQFDRPAPGRTQTQPYVVSFSWDPLLVMQVRTPTHLGTRLYLPDWETVREPVSNTKPWAFEVAKIAQNRVLVLARVAGDDTIVTINGASGNSYVFYVRAEGFNATTAPDAIAVVDARPPNAGRAPVVSVATGMQTTATGAAVDPSSLQFVHRWFIRDDRDREIAPERIFQSGAYTYFDFGARAATMTRPAIFAVVDGVDTQVNVETKGEQGQLLRVDAIDGDFLLRSGERLVCVRWQGRNVAGAVAAQEQQPRSSLRSLLR